MYPLVSELAADGIPVVVSCRVLKLARQPYYRWLRDPVTRRELEEAYRANALFDAHRDDPEFGYRLLADEARDVGEPMSDRTAWRITSANAWWSAFGKKRSKNGKKPGPAVHDDLCLVIDEHGRERHRFVASRPNQLWLTDITEHWNPSRRRPALSLRRQRRFQRPDRGLFDRLAYEGLARCPRRPKRGPDAR